MQKYPESSKNGKATGQSRINYFGQKYLEEILRNNYFLTILEYFRKSAKQQMRKKSANLEIGPNKKCYKT